MLDLSSVSFWLNSHHNHALDLHPSLGKGMRSILFHPLDQANLYPLKTKAAVSSKTLVPLYQTTGHHIPEDSNLH
jgi:hypothetical protein